MKKFLLIILFAFAVNRIDAQTSDSVALEKREVFSSVEQNPQYPGGMSAFDEYIKKNVNFPKDSISNSVTINLFFEVDESGVVSHIKADEVAVENEGFAAEAIRLISSTGVWEPGKMGAKKVRVLYQLAVKFYSNKYVRVIDIQKANDMYERGNFALRQGAYVEAERFYTESILIRPTADSYFNRSAARKQNGKEAESCEDLYSAGYKGDTESQQMFVSGCKQYYNRFQLTDDPTFKEEIYFSPVERSPEYPGGDAARIKFVENNIVYPKSIVNRIEGVVYVTFVIERDGTTTDIKIARSLHPELDKEAIRVVSQMPKWLPGVMNGEPVRVQYNLPVKFTLGNGRK